MLQLGIKNTSCVCSEARANSQVLNVD